MHYTFPSVCWHVCEREGKQKGCVSSARAHTPVRLRRTSPLKRGMIDLWEKIIGLHIPLCALACV
jgi:hypothetical protein